MHTSALGNLFFDKSYFTFQLEWLDREILHFHLNAQLSANLIHTLSRSEKTYQEKNPSCYATNMLLRHGLKH